MYLMLTGIGLFILFVILTDLGPQNSPKRFWRVLQRRLQQVQDPVYNE